MPRNVEILFYYNYVFQSVPFRDKSLADTKQWSRDRLLQGGKEPLLFLYLHIDFIMILYPYKFPSYIRIIPFNILFY